jgi:hypothetical protein
MEAVAERTFVNVHGRLQLQGRLSALEVSFELACATVATLCHTLGFFSNCMSPRFEPPADCSLIIVDATAHGCYSWITDIPLQPFGYL